MKPPQLFASLAFGLGLGTSFGSALSADLERGKLLYENHCTECHESQLHISEHRDSSSAGDVAFQISRWQQELNLNWQNEEINDVLKYLDDRFYHFKARR